MIGNPSHESLLDKVVEELRQATVPPLPDVSIDFCEAPQNTTQILNANRSRFLSRRSVTIAASLLVAMTLLFTQWESPTAIAQVQAAVQSAKAIRFKMQTLVNGEVVEGWRILMVDNQGVRAESAERLHIFDFKSQEMLEVNHTEQSALIGPVYDSDALKRDLAGGIGRLSSLEPIEQTRVRQTVREGKQVTEIWSVWDGAVAKTTMDAKSGLPLHIEIDRGRDSEGRSIREEITAIQFDVAVDREEFIIRAPEAYQVVTIERTSVDERAKQFVLSDQGLAPVTWGMKRDAVIAKLGKPDKIKSNPGMEPVIKDGKPVLTPGVGAGIKMAPAEPPYEVIVLHYDSKGFRIILKSNFGVTNVRCYDARIASPYCRKFEGQTAKGIRIGMTKKQVLEQLGAKDLPIGRFDFRDDRLVAMSSHFKSD